MTEFSKDVPLEVTIRPVTIDDLPAIFHLGENLFRPQEVSNLYRTWDEYEVTGMFNSEPDHMLVAEVAGNVIGFALGTVIEKPGTAWSYGHLVWLGVEEAYARQGVASQLFGTFRNLMEEAAVRILLVDTQADNKAAVDFFEKKGFCNPIEHVYMSLNLDNRDNDDGT